MTARVATLPQGFVVGDGRSSVSAARSRWARHGWMIALITTALGVLAFLALTEAPTSAVPLSIDNAEDEGTRAVAEILRDQGVTVTEVGTLKSARSALGDDGTLVIASYNYLSYEQATSIAGWDGPVVWLSPYDWDLYLIDDRISYANATSRATVQADCAVPGAVAAEQVTVDGSRVRLTRESALATTCFTGAGDAGLLVQFGREGKEALTVVAAPAFMTNADLALEGNAALALHLLGSTDHVAWYMGGPFDTSTLSGTTTQGGGVRTAAPAWMNAALLGVAITFFAAALWRGRRMGKLVTEPLPVVVPASEATRGRARLYRRGRATAHAAAALRAGAARRTSARLGLGPHATPDQLVAAIAAATGRDSTEPRSLLYGPPPRDEAAMLDLVRRLDALESEVDPT